MPNLKKAKSAVSFTAINAPTSGVGRSRSVIQSQSQSVLKRLSTYSVQFPTSGPLKRCLSTIMAFGWLCGVVGIILECVALWSDGRWNAVVRGEAPFSDVGGQVGSFFTGKTLNFSNLLDPEHYLRGIEDDMKRGSALEFLGCVFVFLALIIAMGVYAVYMSSNIANNWMLTGFHLCIGILLIAGGSLMIVTEFSEVDSHKNAIDKLENYLMWFEKFENVPRDFPMDNFRVLRLHLINLIHMERLCLEKVLLGIDDRKHPTPIYIVGTNFHVLPNAVDVEFAQKLNVCSKHTLELLGGIFCIVYGIICFIIPYIVCYQDTSFDKVNPWETDETRDMMSNVRNMIEDARTGKGYMYYGPSYREDVEENVIVAPREMTEYEPQDTMQDRKSRKESSKAEEYQQPRISEKKSQTDLVYSSNRKTLNLPPDMLDLEKIKQLWVDEIYNTNNR